MNATQTTIGRLGYKNVRKYLGWSPERFRVEATGDDALPYALYERHANHVEPVDYYECLSDALVAKLKAEWETRLFF